MRPDFQSKKQWTVTGCDWLPMSNERPAHGTRNLRAQCRVRGTGVTCVLGMKTALFACESDGYEAPASRYKEVVARSSWSGALLQQLRVKTIESAVPALGVTVV